MPRTTAPSAQHVPVLVSEIVRYLPPRPQATIVDGTIGLGGHGAALLERLAHGRLIGLDRDPASVAQARLRLARWADRVTLRHASFSQLPEVLQQLSIPVVDGILLDLGWSSWQLVQAERGFSFQREGPLDMRFDPSAPSGTAALLLRRLSLPELAHLFRTLGEERYADAIARAIVQTRRQQPLTTTTQLAALIERTVPASARHGRLHPATRVFQALRMAVNRELEELQQFLDIAPDLLAPGGRLVILTFQSLEDRLVKQAMQRWARERTMRVLTPKPLRPAPEEIARNPRSRSAKLRAAERLEPSSCG